MLHILRIRVLFKQVLPIEELHKKTTTIYRLHIAKARRYEHLTAGSKCLNQWINFIMLQWKHKINIRKNYFQTSWCVANVSLSSKASTTWCSSLTWLHSKYIHGNLQQIKQHRVIPGFCHNCASNLYYTYNTEKTHETDNTPLMNSPSWKFQNLFRKRRFKCSLKDHSKCNYTRIRKVQSHYNQLVCD